MKRRKAVRSGGNYIIGKARKEEQLFRTKSDRENNILGFYVNAKVGKQKTSISILA